MAKRPKIKCDRCGASIAVTHMARHQGTWACLHKKFLDDLLADNKVQLEEGVVVAETNESLVVNFANHLGIVDSLKSAVYTHYGQLYIGLAGPDWLIASAHACSWWRRKPSVMCDVSIVCRYLKDHPKSAIRDGFTVALSMVDNDDDLSFEQVQERKRELFRSTANRIMHEHPGFALGDEELNIAGLVDAVDADDDL